MEVDNISSLQVNNSQTAKGRNLVIDANEIKSILYLGIKGVHSISNSDTEKKDSNHIVDTFV